MSCQGKVLVCKPILYEKKLLQNIQATMCSYGTNATSKHMALKVPDGLMFPLHKQAIITYKLNHSHKGTGSKPLSVDK